jgi:3-hydroxyisobutyrate dehydrogenase-like beta-hydroxyacid dehydrogenase
MTITDTQLDTQREIALISRAQLLTDLEISVAAAIDELREMADGRADLLANAAASQIGAYLAAPRTTDPYHLLAGTFLVLAGADTDTVEDAVESVRRWARLLEQGMQVGAA